MRISLQVVSIGENSVGLLGDKTRDYLYLPNAELYSTHVDERLSVSFPSEKEMMSFLQKLINEGVPFFDSDYPDGYSAYFFAKELVQEGQLTGSVLRAVWEDGEYRIEDADD